MAADGKRRWLRQERNKNDFNNDLPALIFVSGTMQALFNASPMVPIIGEPRLRVVHSGVPTSYCQYLMLRAVQHQPERSLDKMLRLSSASELALSVKRRTTTLVLTLGLPQATNSREVEARR